MRSSFGVLWKMVRIQVVIENEFFLAYQRSFAYIKIVLNKVTVAYIFQIMYVGSKNGNIILLLVAELFLDIHGHGRTIIPG